DTSRPSGQVEQTLPILKASTPNHPHPALWRVALTPTSRLKSPNDGDPKTAKAQPFTALRLIWHDYPGEWFEEDPSSDEEASRRIETFTQLLQADVALILVDGQKLLTHAGEEEKYLKSMLWGLRDGLEKLKDEILPDGEPLARFPRIWVLALSKADLHPGLDVHQFHDLVVEKAGGDVTALHQTLKEFVQVPDALSLGEDFLLLSSARFEPGKIEVAQRIGLDLILPVALMLPLERTAQWANRFDIPLKVLRVLVENAQEVAAVLTAGAVVVAKLLARVPKVGPLLSKALVPALVAAVQLSTKKLEEIHTKALADRDYLTATLAQFRLDLDRGVKDNVLVKGPW
ncbi:MAG: hypothetical protein WBL05_01420, partial [Brooklawnia sp.]|uniref:hypothetical protein n=1 Tax=Brooklawnia sp. TaxID=2699740 RepID=UPI003C71EA06